MDQLAPEDARLLYADTPQANGNVSLIHIYDQRTAPGGVVRFKTILAHVESRLGRSPVFRRKLKRVPLELDLPYWVDDEHFDLEYHVRHLALPKPGDWRQFCIQVSRLHARALDLERPLWEIYVIEGLDSFTDLPAGSFALLTKTHQAAIAIDGGAEFSELLHDLAPAPAAPAPPAPWVPGRAPSAGSVLTRGLVRSVTAPLRLAAPVARALAQAAPALARAGERWLGDARLPVTRFNSALSPHRVFETRRFALDDFKRMRTLVDGASVNDVVLAVCGGALRRYLEQHGELPAASLSAMSPVYTHGADDETGDAPALSWLQVRLCTDLADARARLEAIVAQTAASGTLKQALPAPEIIARQAPAATLALASKLFGRTLAELGRLAPLAHCTITNVPGAAQPLYLCGARLTYFSALLPLGDGMGLVFAVTSYDGRIVISPTSCRELMPDPEVFAALLRESFQELLAACDAARPVARRAG